MSDTTISLRRKITSAGDLQSVVRTMKALAASSIGQYDQSVRSLAGYTQVVEWGLGVCLRKNDFAVLMASEVTKETDSSMTNVIVFGSDQGLVGQFNEGVVEYTIKITQALPRKFQVWAVGERAYARLIDAGLKPTGLFMVPGSVKAITPLIGKIVLEIEIQTGKGSAAELLLIYNSRKSGAIYESVHQKVFPLDAVSHREITARPWPTKNLPEVIGGDAVTLRALIREYLFILIFKACAESLASENASRLAAMERADKNIDELLNDLNGSFRQLRQSSIDEELFDVISGFEALGKEKVKRAL